MLQRTNETKVMRDVIHGYIHIDLQVIWDLIDAKEFQRLRRINQLGGVFQVYHNAEHTRFSHSLGVYEIVRRMVHEIHGLKEELSEDEKACVMIAGLLHDIGHLPFSHAFEPICATPHEEFSKKIILEESEIHDILVKCNPEFPQIVANIIEHNHDKELMNQLVSGQLDADRMDYLLRDAYFTGTSYGNFDLERILRTIRVQDNQLVVKESGIHSVEDYIMARYHMYWQVYYHPIARSYEAILEKIFKRMKDIYPTHREMFKDLQMFTPFLSGEVNIQDHFILDEAAAYYGFNLLSNKEDEILQDLCKRLLNRRLFDYKNISTKEELNLIRKQLQEKGYDERYYLKEDKMTQSPYSPYQTGDSHNIYVLDNSKEVKELSKVSVIVRSCVQGDVKEDLKVFYVNKDK